MPEVKEIIVVCDPSYEDIFEGSEFYTSTFALHLPSLYTRACLSYLKFHSDVMATSHVKYLTQAQCRFYFEKPIPLIKKKRIPKPTPLGLGSGHFAHPPRCERYSNLLCVFRIDTKEKIQVDLKFALPGKERQDSVYSGLQVHGHCFLVMRVEFLFYEMSNTSNLVTVAH